MTGLPVKSCICGEEANLTVEGGSLKGPGNKLNNVTPFARIYVLPRVQQPSKFYLHVVTTVSFGKHATKLYHAFVKMLESQMYMEFYGAKQKKMS